MSSLRIALPLIALLSPGPGTFAPAAAQETADHLVPPGAFVLPEDLEVTLWAQSPQLFNPTNIDIDFAGRIWVAEGRNYRRHADRVPEGDRIVVLEDTDGDGHADSSHVFVQEPGIISPLGIAVIDNRIVVSSTPDLIVYTDVDRDLRFDPAIDKRDVLLTGFNGKNHDHSLHSVTVGPDGFWYFNHGNSGAMFTDRSGHTFRIGSLYDPLGSGATPLYSRNPIDIAGAKSDDGHVYVGGFAARMKPDGTNVQIIGYNFRNSYEQTVSSFGDVFQNDNDDPPACRTTFLMEYGNLGFFSRDGRRAWGADKRPGQTTPIAEWRQEDPGTIPAGDVYGGGAPTGIVIYEGDALGPDWRGVLLSAEAARNTIFGYFPKADGAGYQLERFDFFTSNKEQEFAGTDFKGGRTNEELKTYFRPSDVAVGPDGAIYIADWFDPRVGGHQDLDDTTSGAIYRVAPRGFVSRVPSFDPHTTAGKIEALRSPAVNVRAIGFYGLREAGGQAVSAVAGLLDDANPFIRARALHLLAQMGPGGVDAVETALADSDPMKRIAAFRALRRSGRDVVDHAHALARDPAPGVRREAALAMRDVPADRALDVLMEVAKRFDGKDRAYLEAWGIGCSGKEAEVFAALLKWDQPRNPEAWSPAYAGLVWRLTPPDAAADLDLRARAETLDAESRRAAVTALGFIPTREAAFIMLDLAQSGLDVAQEQALWWVLNGKNHIWREFGLDAELKARGIYDPDTVTIAPSIVPEPTSTTMPPVAEIAALTGDATRGKDKVSTCFLCHRLGDQGVDYAPDLSGWASRQATEAVIEAIINPSADIAHGYEGTAITLKDGTEVQGIAVTTDDPVVIRSMGGITQMIPDERIAKRGRFRRSLMLSAEQLGLTPQDVADIVAYLKTQ